MKVIFIKQFSIEDEATQVIDLMEDGTGDTIVDEVALQVIDDADITISGRVEDSEDVESIAISAINQGDLTVVSSIETAGIYLIPTEGLSSITLDIAGSTDLIVKALG